MSIDPETNPHIGSSFESWLEEEGIKEECKVRALRELQKEGHKLTKYQQEYLTKFEGQFLDNLTTTNGVKTMNKERTEALSEMKLRNITVAMVAQEIVNSLNDGESKFCCDYSNHEWASHVGLISDDMKDRKAIKRIQWLYDNRKPLIVELERLGFVARITEEDERIDEDESDDVYLEFYMEIKEPGEAEIKRRILKIEKHGEKLVKLFRNTPADVTAKFNSCSVLYDLGILQRQPAEVVAKDFISESDE